MRKRKSAAIATEPPMIPRPGSKVWKGERWGVAQSTVASSGVPQMWVAWWNDEKDNFEIPLPELAALLTIDPNPNKAELMPFIVVPAPKINWPPIDVPESEPKIDSPSAQNPCYSVEGESQSATPSGDESLIHENNSTPGAEGESIDLTSDSPSQVSTPGVEGESIRQMLHDIVWNGCVVEKSPAGTARTDAKYYWYKWRENGKQREIYIRGGHTGNPIAKMRADVIKLGIRLGKTPAELIETIQGFGKKS